MKLTEPIQQVMEASGAQFGLALRHLETGEELLLDADAYYVLASTFKVPVLVEAFFQIGAGRLSLAERLPLRTADKNLGSGVLTFFDDGLMPTVRDLLTLMIIISDNTATDMVINRLGIASITETMRALGLQDIHLPMTIRQIFETILPSPDPTQDPYDLALRDVQFTAPPKAAGYSKGSDNNVSTPADMTKLLELIFRGRAASPAATEEM